ncbi:hypothetical protein SteCoe_26384 [Stentor coeruleus]|uniref:VWFA domain-containing protein n=1 Tax=Stentor coeruleus TaxID=5963 RepID=A0A1R2BD62_9CILI|nr:hypothetical protein SteCoe_26384 [Stentor coeruleus]
MASIGTQLIAQLLASLGFEPINKSTIIPRLNRIRPYGETALNDAVHSGIKLILKLNSALDDLGASNAWNFVHIVITDGVDTVSDTSIQELAVLFAMINRGISTERCLTVFIGVDLTPQALVQLALLKSLGGENCQLYNVRNVDLSEIFQRITATLGVQRRVNVNMLNMGGIQAMHFQQENVPVMTIRQRNFAVLLNLDISGSMDGTRYESLKNSVSMFLRNLAPNDLASCLVFNDRVQMLNNIPLQQPKQDVQVIQCQPQ